MEERVYKENLKRMILEMAQDEISNYSSQKGVQKYFEGNIDKIINENIKNYLDDISVNKIYSKILKRGSSQENVQSVARVIKSEELFKSKNELVKFARYLGINVNAKSSYTQTLKRISNYIYLNRKEYSEKYVLYRNGDEECILEPEKIKLDLIESYKSKTRKDMKSIARLLDINVEDEESAEDIRRKVINYIMKDYDNDADSIWKSEIFGRSLDVIVKEGIQAKLSMLPENARFKLQQTLSKLVNKGNGNLFAIVL